MTPRASNALTPGPQVASDHTRSRALESRRLAVANGGILTLPETGRVKRNLATMDSSLALIDPLSGAVTEQFRLPDRYMSIRHPGRSAHG